MTNIERIRELLEEYRDCPSELDPYKVAVEIDSLYQKGCDIAENMEDYWKSLRCGAEK